MPPDLYLIACHVWQTVQYCQSKFDKEGLKPGDSLAKTLLRESNYLTARIGGAWQLEPIDKTQLADSKYVLLFSIQRLRWLIDQIEAMNYVK